MPTALRILVEHGQRTGELRRYPSALDISGMIINLLLIRGLNLPHEQPEATTELLLTMMFGALRPELLLDPDRAGRPFACPRQIGTIRPSIKGRPSSADLG